MLFFSYKNSFFFFFSCVLRQNSSSKRNRKVRKNKRLPGKLPSAEGDSGIAAPLWSGINREPVYRKWHICGSQLPKGKHRFQPQTLWEGKWIKQNKVAEFHSLGNHIHIRISLLILQNSSKKVSGCLRYIVLDRDVIRLLYCHNYHHALSR